MKTYEVPTGEICIIDGEKGRKLEFLSIGDYGKEANIKADFLGLTEEINGVEHRDILPLEEKWVITISSQYGCSMACSFCDVPKVGRGINATFADLTKQFFSALEMHPEVKRPKRINLHYARMGEPTWNYDVVKSANYIRAYLSSSECGFHPVVSTMMPKNNKHLSAFIDAWLDYKDLANGDAGLQLSINTTDEKRRSEMMPHAMSVREISDTMCDILQYRDRVKGRKITLNFALTDAPIDAKLLADLFRPSTFLCKITPMHKTNACVDGELITDNGYDHYYPYKETEESLKAEGFDVIVFIPSKEEDESKITCGNAILATGTK
jgi:23S rRNA (adenine2503-C2)-methyltransferase